MGRDSGLKILELKLLSSRTDDDFLSLKFDTINLEISDKQDFSVSFDLSIVHYDISFLGEIKILLLLSFIIVDDSDLSLFPENKISKEILKLGCFARRIIEKSPLLCHHEEL